MTQLTLHIEGMSCGHCLNAVNKALRSLDGVEIESVQIGRAEVRYDESRLDPDRIAAAITAEGYRASVQPGR
jgi:copper chaperone CopZ